MKKIITLFVLCITFAACKNDKADKPTESPAVVQDTDSPKWTVLFDGSSTEGWRGYNQENLPEGWVIEDKMLKSLGKGGDIGGDIIYAGDTYGEFELTLEWKISEGGNSGIFYHVVEGEQYQAPYQNSPEYQVIDQLGFPSKLEPWQSIAADYGMYNADVEGVVKEAGTWNSTRIKFTNEKVEYYLNGKQTLSFVPWSDDWEQRKSEGKWKDYPDYGKAKEGYIGLQDHGSFIWFKNIKIRKL